MTALPPAYQWLAAEGAPRMLVEALALYGTLEAPGARDNPTILAWACQVGVAADYRHDLVPWCGLFMAVVAQRAGKRLPPQPLRALSWLDFGVPVRVPMLGDVLVFHRDGGGHVTLCVGEDADAWHCLGGNQHDAVSIARIAKARQPEARRPHYTIQPANVRRVQLAAGGAISTRET